MRTATPRELLQAAKAKAAGAKYPLRIIWTAKDYGIPLSYFFAVIEQESQFENIFGCDKDSILCHQKVTKDRVRRLIRHVEDGGVSNGVGLTQLTSLGYILLAEGFGGAHVPRNQIRAGAEIIIDKTGGHMSQIWRYNGHRSYQQVIEAKKDRWHKILK